MDPQTLLPPCRPLPTLPIEMQQHVLRFCDPSTLYNTSLVSLAFLELSSPILCEEIEITGLLNLELLFCSRDGTTQTQVAPFLALSHIRTFTILATSDYGGTLKLFQDRLTSSSIAVDLLTFRPFAIKQNFKNLRNHNTEDEQELDRWDALTPFFNPNTFHILGLTAIVPNQTAFLYPNHTTVLFSNLKKLLFKDVHVFHWKTGEPVVEPWLSAAKLVSIVFDACEGGDLGGGRSSDLSWQIGLCLLSMLFGGVGSTVGDVVVKVSSKEMKREILHSVWEVEGREDLRAKFERYVRFEEVGFKSGNEE